MVRMTSKCVASRTTPSFSFGSVALLSESLDAAVCPGATGVRGLTVSFMMEEC